MIHGLAPRQPVDDSTLTKFPGYVPGRWLREHQVGAGSCLPDEWNNAIFYTDPSATPESGDYVVVFMRSNVDGEMVDSRIKILETDSTGRWWGVCLESVLPLGKFNDAGEHLYWPAHVEKIVARRDGARTLSRPAGIASPEHLRLLDDISRHVRAEWIAKGKRRGVPYPGTKAVCRLSNEAMKEPLVRMLCELPADYLERHTAKRLVGKSVIPASNPTTPSVPQNISIRAVNGTLEFSWDTPAVLPRGTTYQIWSAVNCGDATTGTLRWQGDAQRATLPYQQVDVSSGSFYWMRSAGVSSGSFSAWTPNTYGTPATFTPPAESRSVISDPQFRQGQSIGSYWIGGFSAPVSLSPTGGPSDGTGKLTVVGSTSFGGFPWTRTVYCARWVNPSGNDPFAPCQPGQWLNWSVMFRRTTTITSGGGFIVYATNRYIVSGANVDLDVGTTLVRCDTVALNTWTTITGSVQMSALDRYNMVAPILKFDYSNLGSGTLEVSGFDATLR